MMRIMTTLKTKSGNGEESDLLMGKLDKDDDKDRERVK